MTIRSGSPGFMTGQSSVYTVSSSWGTFGYMPAASGRWTIELQVNSTGLVDFRAVGSILSETSNFNMVTTTVLNQSSAFIAQSATKVWHTIALQAQQSTNTTGAKTIQASWIAQG